MVDFSLKAAFSSGLFLFQISCFFKSVCNKPHSIIFIKKTKIFTSVFLGYFYKTFLSSWWISKLKKKKSVTKCHGWLWIVRMGNVLLLLNMSKVTILTFHRDLIEITYILCLRNFNESRWKYDLSGPGMLLNQSTLSCIACNPSDCILNLRKSETMV